MARRSVAQQREFPSIAFEAAGASKPRGEELGYRAYRKRLRSRYVQDSGRRFAVTQRPERVRVRVALPDHVESGDCELDGFAGMHFACDIDEHAVAKVDRIVEAEQKTSEAVVIREVLEDALAPQAGLRILAHGVRGIAFVRTSARRFAK